MECMESKKNKEIESGPRPLNLCVASSSIV